jgi:tetratricopeptide (TPR) repeat protein
LLKASNEITTCCVALGQQALKDNKEEAAKFFKEGMENAEAAAKYWPKDAEVLYNKAYCQLASGEKANINLAVESFRDLRQGTSDENELWWRATKGFLEGLVALGNYPDARGVLQQILLTFNQDVVTKNWPEIYEVAADLALNKMKLDSDQQKALEKFLGDKIPVPKLSYDAKSELERMIELNIRSVNDDVQNGKIAQDEGKFRVELLTEMAGLARGRKLKPSLLTLEDVYVQIKNGRIRSLVTLGGISRGAEGDQTAPPPKAAPKEEKDKEKDKEKPKDSSAVPPWRPARAVAALAGEEGAA